ncbi:MAG TPA: hypothetical protein VKX17_19455 [Planctomycetota bacterium]|nr:hypothetical protein [Planctomycetota bacterium]
MKHKEATIHYCAQCRMTTTHAVAGELCTCKRCGSVKTLERFKVRHHHHHPHHQHSHGHATANFEMCGCTGWN